MTRPPCPDAPDRCDAPPVALCPSVHAPWWSEAVDRWCRLVSGRALIWYLEHRDASPTCQREVPRG